MKMKKKIAIVFFTITLVISILNYAHAAEGQSMELSLKLDNKSYQIGDEILVDVYIDEIKGFSGINTFVAKKVYNSENLEYIGTTVANDNWEVIGDSANIVLRKMEGEDLSTGRLCTLKFKVLKDEDTIIQLSEVDACNNEGDVYFEDENVNSPSIQISIDKIREVKKQEKSYIGVALIAVGTLGLIGIGLHYILNKNKA